MNLVGEEFEDKVSYYRDAWWPARELVEHAVEKRFEVTKSFITKTVFISFVPCKQKVAESLRK